MQVATRAALFAIEQELPPELQGKDVSTEGEASLRGHLSNEGGGEEGGSKYDGLKVTLDFFQNEDQTRKRCIERGGETCACTG